ncbi:MAG: SDR family oxidoreductase [Beijerinckiaceae bacterium]|nr:SDR family oxidoreductase [Beijerinckiaceae bacterium]
MSGGHPLALVTGGGGALGCAIATALVRDGWRVALADRDSSALERAAKSIDGGHLAAVHVCDVCDESAVRNVVSKIIAAHGRLHGLATAAGGGPAFGPRALFWQTTPQDWRLNIETHLVSVMSTCHAVLPHLIENAGGVILNVASGAGLRGGPPMSRQKFGEVYSLAKAGVIAFTKSIALEFASHGVRANCIAPGRAENSRRPVAELTAMAVDEERKEPGSSRMSPLGRFGRAEDMGEAAAFLMSARAGYITGSCLDISGGVRLH